MGIEDSIYKEENLEIKDENELEKAKEATGVKSHEAAMDNAAQHALETDDDKLLDNAAEQGANLDEVDKRMQGTKKIEQNSNNETDGYDDQLVKDAIEEVAEGDEDVEVRFTKRAGQLRKEEKDIEKVINTIRNEAKNEKNKVLPDDTKKEFIN